MKKYMIALATVFTLTLPAHAEQTAAGAPQILMLSPGERIMSIEDAKAYQAQRKAAAEQNKAEAKAAAEAKKAEVQNNIAEKREKVRERVNARKAEMETRRAERKAKRQKAADEIKSGINTLKNTISE